MSLHVQIAERFNLKINAETLRQCIGQQHNYEVQSPRWILPTNTFPILAFDFHFLNFTLSIESAIQSAHEFSQVSAVT